MALELRVSALPAHVRTARLIVAVAARRIGVDDAALDEVRLAVGEACARAVELHQAHAPHELVEIAVDDDDNRFRVTVRDIGPPFAEVAAVEGLGLRAPTELFDPAVLAAPAASPADDLPPGPGTLPSGFGLAIIRGLVDDLTVEPATGGRGTVIGMSWPVTAPPSGAARRR